MFWCCSRCCVTELSQERWATLWRCRSSICMILQIFLLIFNSQVNLTEGLSKTILYFKQELVGSDGNHALWHSLACAGAASANIKSEIGLIHVLFVNIFFTGVVKRFCITAHWYDNSHYRLIWLYNEGVHLIFSLWLFLYLCLSCLRLWHRKLQKKLLRTFINSTFVGVAGE